MGNQARKKDSACREKENVSLALWFPQVTGLGRILRGDQGGETEAELNIQGDKDG